MIPLAQNSSSGVHRHYRILPCHRFSGAFSCYIVVIIIVFYFMREVWYSALSPQSTGGVWVVAALVFATSNE